jgi:hypothetical protein
MVLSARGVFDSRALVVRTGRRVGANDEEVVIRGQALVPRAGRQDGRVAGFQREDPTFVAAEALFGGPAASDRTWPSEHAVATTPRQ